MLSNGVELSDQILNGSVDIYVFGAESDLVWMFGLHLVISRSSYPTAPTHAHIVPHLWQFRQGVDQIIETNDQNVKSNLILTTITIALKFWLEFRSFQLDLRRKLWSPLTVHSGSPILHIMGWQIWKKTSRREDVRMWSNEGFRGD